jgi:hypothetical protein
MSENKGAKQEEKKTQNGKADPKKKGKDVEDEIVHLFLPLTIIE